MLKFDQNLPEIASLWIGEKLSFLEQLCLKSYLDNGHRVTLYAYEEVGAVPKGVLIKDARELYRGEPYHIHIKHQTPAIHADYFRVKLMRRGLGEIWVDTDAYCHKPFDFSEPHVYGLLDGQVANGVMRVPADSPALLDYETLLFDPLPVPPFFPVNVKFAINLLREYGFCLPLEAMTWGTTGPAGFTHFLNNSGEIKLAKAQHVFYPTGWQERRKFLRPTDKFMKNVAEDTLSFHFYGRIVRRILSEEFNGLPAPRSILADLCEKHDIDANSAPIIWQRSRFQQ